MVASREIRDAKQSTEPPCQSVGRYRTEWNQILKNFEGVVRQDLRSSRRSQPGDGSVTVIIWQYREWYQNGHLEQIESGKRYSHS